MKIIFFATLLAFIILVTATAAGATIYIFTAHLGNIAVFLSTFISAFVGTILGILVTKEW